MLRFIIRMLQRAAIFGLGILSIWLIVDVFRLVDRRLDFIFAMAAAYAIGAYIILPRAILMGLKILQQQHVPSFTITGDGLPGDPVNLALAGTFGQLRAAFAAAGWVEADRLNLRSSWHMARSFVLNTPYPTAPFSTLFLFGRGQDIGFQKAIDDSPRKRHHVRFWAQSLAHAQTADASTLDFWLNTDRPDDRERVLWVGAGTRDTGFSLTRLTFQITHATDADTNAERNFIISELTGCGAIRGATLYNPGDQLATAHVNHYIADGEIAVAEIQVPAIKSDVTASGKAPG
jgi:LssY C-terminus